MIQQSDFHNEAALLERLSTGLKKRRQEVVFLVGAPLSAPTHPGQPGVPDVSGMIALIRSEFEGEVDEQAALDNKIATSGPRAYQEAFSFLQGRRGQQTVNEIVCRAVLSARTVPPVQKIDFSDLRQLEASCRALELDFPGWTLNTGTEFLGNLVARYPDYFGHTLLTTNFDPLLEVAIRRADGKHYRTVIPADGNLSQTEAPGCHVIHLHGYWFGADTLHTARQLGQSRPHLNDSLRSLLRNKLVVVCAYGGWDDVFTGALMDVVRDLTEHPEVIWTFYGSCPSVEDELARWLNPGLDRGTVTLYAGIDCNHFLPRLYERWVAIENPLTPSSNVSQSNPVQLKPELLRQIADSRAHPVHVVEGNDEDRPPVVEFCVGREQEFQKLQSSNAKAVFLTGMGGQGKSTIAAQYFSESLQHREFSFYVWRDCKEERERFENQLASVIERLSDGAISGEDLASQSAASIVRVLFSVLADKKVLFVFDNADHYVDLEKATMTGTADVFVSELVKNKSSCRAIFTCRPRIAHSDSDVLSMHLEGLSLNATIQLFSRRAASSNLDEITEAHRVTEGHAFWLDLLAIQVAKQSGATTLLKLITEIDSRKGLLPEKTLNSIWNTLADRERTVLSALAESVKPATESELGDYLSDKLNFNKVMKALKHLRTLNLVVVKRRPGQPDVLELHPLVRLFIRNSTPQQERLTLVEAIIRTYQKFMKRHKEQLQEKPSLVVLKYWTESAELDIRAARYHDAFSTLAEAASPFLGSAYRREYTRVTRDLLDRSSWVESYGQYPEFDQVFRVHIHILADLGEREEIDRLLEHYALTVPNKDVRYIQYCDLHCYASWVRGEFSDAIKWGQEGQALKTESGVDTSTDIEHNLALALRDAGRPDSALPIFLKGKELSQVTDPDELEEDQFGHFYGNIGRCLHLMGDIEGALVCYQKSAILLERARGEHVINQGFVRAWIAELLVSRRLIRLAYMFFTAAAIKWEHTAPPRAAHAEESAAQLKARLDPKEIPSESIAEQTCVDWILGKYVDV